MPKTASPKQQNEKITQSRKRRTGEAARAKRIKKHRTKEDASKRALCRELKFLTGDEIKPDELLPGFSVRVHEKVKPADQQHLWFCTHTYCYGRIPALILRPFNQGYWQVFLPLAWVAWNEALDIELVTALTLRDFLTFLKSRGLPLSSRHEGGKR